MMKKFMKKLWEKKDSKKGFTLVELIVVLVILAILAAIMVPALIGWIDKANEKQVVVEARTAYLAAQTIASEQYARDNGDFTEASTNFAGETATDTGEDLVCKLAGFTDTEVIIEFTAAGGKVTAFKYTDGDVVTANSGTLTATLDVANGTGWTVKKN